MTTVEKIDDRHAETALEQAALDWINEQAENYEDTGAEGVLSDLMQGGCASGMVSDLIYSSDTIKFFKAHRDDIGALLHCCLFYDPSKLFGDKWDKSDPLASDTNNQNLLAWFGFEEAARIVASRAGIDI